MAIPDNTCIVHLKSPCTSPERRSSFRTLYAHANPLVCETSADSLSGVTSARSEFYTHALAYSHIAVAPSTQCECSLVTLYAHAIAILRACTTRASGNERVLALYVYLISGTTDWWWKF